MLSDGAGVFGFFLGVSLLLVLQRLFNSIVKIMIDTKKCLRRFFRRFKLGFIFDVESHHVIQINETKIRDITQSNTDAH